MTRSTAFVVALIIAGSAPMRLHAQKTKPVAVADTTKKKFVGQWEGTYFSDHSGENALKITIARDTAWKGTIEFTADQPIPPAAMADLAITGSNVTWTQSVMGMSCVSSGAVIGESMKGEIKCGQMSIGFLLKKHS